MSAKIKGRGAQVLKVPHDENPKGPSSDNMDSPNLSVIDKASFLEGLHLDYGNPLHSTAMEEDLNVQEEGRKAGRKDAPRPLKTTSKQRGAAVKRKEPERDEENKEEGKTRSRKRSGGRVEAGPEKEGGTTTPAATRLKPLTGKKAAKRTSSGPTPAARPKRNQMKNGEKKGSKSGSGQSSGPLSQEDSDTGTTKPRRKKVLSSDEELVEEEESWVPTPKRAKVYRFGRTKKSSSGSTSSGAEKADAAEQRKKRRGVQGQTESGVVLGAFLDFCEQYSESVESKAVKQSIASFSSGVEEQLLEKISCQKELRVLKRENAKVGSLIRTKTQRMLDAKYELLRAERQISLLQKEKADLELRLADLRLGRAFLHDIKELSRQYLDYRHKHPKEKETYGASSLPALLLETKHVQSTEHQLRGINNQLEENLKTDKPLK